MVMFEFVGATVVAIIALYFGGESLVPGAVCLYAAPVDSSGKVMAALKYDEHGSSSETLQYVEDYPQPSALPDQVVVQIKFAAINPCDFKLRRVDVPNAMPRMVADWLFPKPKISSEDLSGLVVEVGSAVTKFSVGDRVAGMLPIIHTRWGSLAQYAAIKENAIALIPNGISFEHAAAMPLTSMTAVQALDNLRGATEGKRILIHAGAGGVGSFAVQWCANVLGMKVSTTSSAKNVEFCKELGAEEVIDYTTTDPLANDPKFDVILDALSYEYEVKTFGAGSVALNTHGGHYLNILGSDYALDSEGQEKANGPETGANFVFFKWCNALQAVGLASAVTPSCPADVQYTPVFVSPDGAVLQRVFAAMSSGDVKATIDSVYPLKDAAKALDRVATGHARGKVLVEIPSSL